MKLRSQILSIRDLQDFFDKNAHQVENLIIRKEREERLLARLADRFMEVEDMNGAIETSLAELGEFTGVDRCIVYGIDGDLSSMDHMYEWCADGIESCLNGLDNIELNISTEEKTELKDNVVTVVDDVSALPAYFSIDREYFIGHGIKSFLNVRFLSEEKIIGFVGFHSVKKQRIWSAEDITLLKNFNNNLWHEIIRKEARDKLQKSMKLLETSFRETIGVMGKMQEIKDHYTFGHQKKVADLCHRVSKKLNLSKEKREAVYYAALVHDIGKIYVPLEILNKPGRISDIEFDLIKKHPETGSDILREVNFPWPVADIILQHHERLDGSGYPRGLKDDEICIEARIIAIADVFDAITSHRPYRAGLGVDFAIEELKKNRDILYDSNIVAAFLAIV